MINEVIKNITKEQLDIENVMYRLHTANTVCFSKIKLTLDEDLIKNLKPENIRAGVTILGVTGTNVG